MQSHPLVHQLRFTRDEFRRGLEGLRDDEARKRFMPMNCISWNVGHLAWHEQLHFVQNAQGRLLLPEVFESFAYGAPASSPVLGEIINAWDAITRAADVWLDTVTTATLQQPYVREGRPSSDLLGTTLQRVIYHYWYHTGENMAIRQMLGHVELPEYVGDIDYQAPFRAE